MTLKTMFNSRLIFPYRRLFKKSCYRHLFNNILIFVCMTAREFEQLTLASLREGDVNSFCRCYDIYFDPLCSFAGTVLRNQAAAEEIVQSLFLELWQKRSDLPEEVPLRAYLLTSVKNDCLDYLKHRKIEKMYAEEYLRRTAVHYEDVFDRLVDRELQKALEEAVNRLPERTREVFTLSRYHYLSYKEIAARLAVSVKTVENQLGHALKALRKDLEQFL